MKTIVIGTMDNSQDHTWECINRVYSAMALAPTINTYGGGNRQPMILEISEIKKPGEQVGKRYM